MKFISMGAEAEIYLRKDTITKKRPKKLYRISEIDLPLRKFRTRREAKIMQKLCAIGISAPKLINVDDVSMSIEMSNVSGAKLRDCLNMKNNKKLCFDLGRIIAQMHNNGIMHGDLTTSNMILHSTGKSSTIFLIDFGLSFFSTKAEDKAVDIHLFRRALESKHQELWDQGFNRFCKGYSFVSFAKDEVFERLEKVESRGRNKTKKKGGKQNKIKK